MINAIFPVKVILVRPQYPDNVGFIARCMKVFGCENLVLVSPQFDSLDPAHKTASGSNDIIDRTCIVNSLKEAVKESHRVVGFSRREHRIERPTLFLDDWLQQLTNNHQLTSNQEQIALVFGPENFGLSNEDKSFCEQIITIPSYEQGISLNLSHAVGIVLHTLYQHFQKFEPQADQTNIKIPATQEEIQRLIDLLLSQLEQTNHFTPSTKIYQIERIKNLIMRLQLSKEEYHAMMGIVKSLSKGAKNS